MPDLLRLLRYLATGNRLPVRLHGVFEKWIANLLIRSEELGA